MHEIQKSALKRAIFTFYWLTNEPIFCIILDFSQENKALKIQKNPEKIVCIHIGDKNIFA